MSESYDGPQASEWICIGTAPSRCYVRCVRPGGEPRGGPLWPSPLRPSVGLQVVTWGLGGHRAGCAVS
jgi:hypothetical protein